jgi:hypothetical protein
MADILNPIVLDPRNEDTLANQAKSFAFQNSNGALNSFNDGDPNDVMVRTQAYTGAELLYYVNLLPLSFALRFLSLADVVKAEGNKAVADVTFTLVSARDADYFVQAGFELIASTTNGTLSFYTAEDLSIPAGSISGTVQVVAAEIGSKYNVSAGAISTFVQPIAYLRSVINSQPAQGGADPETDESVVQRGVAALRRRAPISESDFEEEAEKILGYGSRCKAVGLLGADKVTTERGAVHLFLLSNTGVPASSAEQKLVQSTISKSQAVGTRLYISPMEQLNIVGKIIATLSPGASPEDAADSLWEKFTAFLSPLSYTPGKTVDITEIGHQMRFSEGIASTETLYLNEDGLPVVLPNEWTLPVAWQLACELVDSTGAVYTLLRGDIGGDD